MWGKVLRTAIVASLALATPRIAWSQATDHAALAAQYEQEAKTLRDKAHVHQEMEAAYDGPKYSKVTNHAGMRNHCKRLISSYEAAAADAEALAKEHRAAAAAH